MAWWHRPALIGCYVTAGCLLSMWRQIKLHCSPVLSSMQVDTGALESVCCMSVCLLASFHFFYHSQSNEPDLSDVCSSRGNFRGQKKKVCNNWIIWSDFTVRTFIWYLNFILINRDLSQSKTWIIADFFFLLKKCGDISRQKRNRKHLKFFSDHKMYVCKGAKHVLIFEERINKCRGEIVLDLNKLDALYPLWDQWSYVSETENAKHMSQFIYCELIINMSFQKKKKRA